MKQSWNQTVRAKILLRIVCLKLLVLMSANTRKGFYPDDIVGTFGVPVEEHLKESEVQQMDGYVSVGMLTGKTIPDTGLD